MKKIRKFQAFVLSLIYAVVFSACASNSGVGTEKNDNPIYNKEELKEVEFNGKTYSEIFYDDFDGTELDKSKWEKCPEWERQTHMKRHGWWSDKCSYVKDGNLVLECKKDADGKLISGGIRSISKDYSRTMFKNSTGVYEIKFKVEKGSGFWYAFWLFANNDEAHIGNGARNGAELDCFEILPGKSGWAHNGNPNSENHMMTTLHWDAYGAAHKMKGTDGIDVTEFDKNFYDNWHVFQFEWGTESYDCYLDGKLLWSMSGKEYGEGICEEPGYMKITTEFGEWGGEIDSVIQGGDARKMLVDYVKVYKQL